jgi:hypothetical protein
MSTPASASKSPWTFFSLLILLSVPFWLIGAFANQWFQERIPIDLPISSLMAMNPALAASILAYWEHGDRGVKDLLKRSVDYRRIQKKIWYLPVFGLWPLTMVVAYGLMRATGASLPHVRLSMLMVPLFFGVFAVPTTARPRPTFWACGAHPDGRKTPPETDAGASIQSTAATPLPSPSVPGAA